ncbi:MAG TPA: flagellar hook-basal body complex protein [Azospirillaceae bacterium]|nr:flagellar hook-basal body complex protein [Azospirillaceae bacterium]
MSINRIFSNGVSGLVAQSNALSVISDNVANATTNGYKRSEAQFSDFRVNDKFGRFFDGAGVQGSQRLLADRQGTVAQTGVTTNAAIVGNGFFIVQDVDNAFGDRQATSDELTDAGNPPELSRAGDFSPDAYGHLVNSAGRALLGQRLTAGQTPAAVTSVNQLELVSMDDMAGYFEGSTEVSVKASLSVDQGLSASGDLTTVDPVKTTVTAVDATGKPAAVGLSMIKTADDPVLGTTWEIYQTSVKYGDGTAAPGVSATPTLLGSLNFGPGGAPTGGADGEAVNMAMALGGNFGAVALNVGAYNRATGLAVTATGTTGSTSFSNSTDGIVADTLSEVQLTDDGYIRATYRGGETRDFYRIPNGYVRNAQGLDAVSGNAYNVTADSGELQFKEFGSKTVSSLVSATDDRATVGAALVANAVEQSNTDISQEFTTMIVAQRTYSANSKVVTTADEMTQTVLGLKN